MGGTAPSNPQTQPSPPAPLPTLTPGHPVVSVATTQDDPRSQQFLCTVTVENRGNSPIVLTRLGASVPRDVTCMEVVDAERARLNALLDELEYIYKYIITNAPLKPSDSLLGRISGFYSNLKERKRLKRAVRFGFEDVADAQAAAGSLAGMSDGDRFKVWKELFNHKLQRAQQYDAQRTAANNGGNGVQAFVWPNSSFTRKFVFDGERSQVSPRKYCVTFEVGYRAKDAVVTDGTIPTYSMSQSTEITITPTAVVLTIFAMLAAIGGVLTTWSAGSGDVMLLCKAVVPAIILAAIFFNTYESTTIGKNLNVGVSWRSAMLIGFLCGLAQDKILAAITGLIGMTG